MRHVKEGDSIIGKRLVFQCRKVDLKKPFRKSGAHRGQRGTIHDGECWIEIPIKLSEG